jgi:hypothetical protein
MADFAHWISACETALWPPGTLAHAYAENRRAAIESLIVGDPVASRVRDIRPDTEPGPARLLNSFVSA